MDLLKKLILGELKLSQVLYYVLTEYRDSFDSNFISWAEQESNGYKDNLNLPDYRYINCEVYAKYTDDFGNEHDEQIDVKAIDDHLLKRGFENALVSKMRISQGIESLENAIADNKDGALILMIPQGMSEMIRKCYVCPAGCHSFFVYQSCHVEQGKNIISVVKAKLITILKDMKQNIYYIDDKKDKAHKPLIFISHASKDKIILKSFVDNILKSGLGLKDENIVFTSYEATGVVPGDNIPEYIKRNIEGASVVMAMVSENYKASEVCMNEVGAAFALGKTPVQIMLPNTNIDKLGWLIHLNKAAKIDDEDSLDSLGEVICTEMNLKMQTPKHWNPCKKVFLEFLKTQLDSHKIDTRDGNNGDCTNPSPKRIKTTERLTQRKSSLHVFDTHFYVRAKDEGEYQYQLNLRFRADIKVVLKEIILVNDHDFTGNVSQPKREVPFSCFIHQGILEIDKIKVDEFQETVISSFKENMIPIIDFAIEKDGQTSLSLIGDFQTIRESDGYTDLPMNHWNLVVKYNIDEIVSIPVTMTTIGDTFGYYWHN